MVAIQGVPFLCGTLRHFAPESRTWNRALPARRDGQQLALPLLPGKPMVFLWKVVLMSLRSAIAGSKAVFDPVHKLLILVL